jgi:microcystin-dependent protein
VTLTTQQIPSHTHSLTGSTANASDPNPTVIVLATATVVQPDAVESVAATFAPSTITPVVGSQPHENCQPFLCINYIISLFGIFPPPN